MIYTFVYFQKTKNNNILCVYLIRKFFPLLLIVSLDWIVEKEKNIYIFHFSQNWLNLKFDSGKRRGEREERAEKEMGLCDGSCEDATNERIEE